MSESSPLEIEPEWCSDAMLSSVSAAVQAEEYHSSDVSISPTAETTIEEVAPRSDELATGRSVPVPPTQPAPKPSTPRSVRHTKSLQTPSGGRLISALRSRRVRVVATLVTVLFVTGLIVVNWRGSPRPSDEVVDLDLSEFNEAPSFEATNIKSSLEPSPLRVLADADARSLASHQLETEAGPRLSPLGAVKHADYEARFSNVQTAGGFAPESSATSRTRGAWLTGQIEFEASPRSDANGQTGRSLGMR